MSQGALPRQLENKLNDVILLCQRFKKKPNLEYLSEAINLLASVIQDSLYHNPSLSAQYVDWLTLNQQITNIEKKRADSRSDNVTDHERLGKLLLERYAKMGSVTSIGQLFINQALTLSDYHNAGVESYFNALYMYEKGQQHHNCLRIGRELGDVLYGQENFAKAYDAYIVAVAGLEKARRVILKHDERQKQSKFNAQLYARLVRCCLVLGKKEEAFHYATAAKGRAFVDLLSSVPLDLSKAQDDELQEKVSRARKLKAQSDRLLAELTGEVGDSSQLSEALRDTLTENRKNSLQEEETLWQQIRTEHPDYFATQAADPLTLAEARELAAHLEATLLSYYRHDKGWVAFVVRDEVQSPLQVVELKVTDEALMREREDFFNKKEKEEKKEKLFSNPQNKITHLNEFYKWLIKPLHSAIPSVNQGQRLVLAPFSILHLVPLAALRHRRRRQRSFYLNEEYDLTITPSLAVLNRIIKRHPQPVREKLCVIAYPGKKGEKHYLPNVVPEAEAIAKHFSNPTKRLDADATRKAALDHAPHHQIHHYACHGIFDAEQTQHSGLFLAGGELLSLRDLFNELRMADNSALTVLSACDTGRVQLQSGDEVAGLLQGFVYAGTPAMIASLWAVNDAATRYLFERFYCYYTLGVAATTALRTAQQEMRQRGYDYPYYWAAFQPFGATFEQQPNPALACSTPLEEVIPTYQPRQMQGADHMSSNLTAERLIDDALDLIRHFQRDVEHLYDTLSDEQLHAFLATLNTWAAQTEPISDEERLLAFANTLITHIEGTPHLCLFFRGYIDAEARKKAREILLKDRKKRQAQKPMREKIEGYEEPKSVASMMQTGIKKAIALLKEEMEA